MRISIEELAVLSVFGNSLKPALDKGTISYHAARLYPAPRFDSKVAQAVIDELVKQRMLATDASRLYQLTREGLGAVLECITVLETLRAATAGTYYRGR